MIDVSNSTGSSTLTGEQPIRLPHVDLLTQALEALRIRCVVRGAHEMTAPWGLRFGGLRSEDLRQHAIELGATSVPRHPPVASSWLVAILRGHCWLETAAPDAQTFSLSAGDLVLLNRRAPFSLSDDPETPVRHVKEIVRREHLEQSIGIQYGGGGDVTRFLTGRFIVDDSDEAPHPLLTTLPPVIHIHGGQGESTAWLDETLRLIARELDHRQPGTAGIVSHLAHALFLHAIRDCAQDLPAENGAKSFEAMLDLEVGQALRQIHERPEEPWTVASLAEHASLSRSVFAARFTAAVGVPPLQYLTDFRMRRARELLRDGKLGMKAVATKVGYATESAFSSAFKRATGMSPGAYRRDVQ